ncbi:MAG TPA: phage tail sheath C-terminal domain-containing protein [Pyrinomonadaceae bacterium]|jgi:hypothetical protein|nr:phage tail sheath C-terminal domain-containing protein [Pyrinomonadaceae bacterium]
MPELILPGVYIEVRPEALIVGGPISVGNIGIVGTASDGPIGEAKILGSYADAREIFGAYDAFDTPNSLTMVRALELAYNNGASTVYAVRVASAAAAVSAPAAANMAGNVSIFTLGAKSPGTAGDATRITIVELPAPSTNSVVTIKRGAVTEQYTVATGTALVAAINDPANGSALVTATAGANAANRPVAITDVAFGGGNNGANAADSDYAAGLAVLQNQNAHIIVAAGQPDNVIGDEMLAHVNTSSDDDHRRDRIGILGSRPKTAAQDASAFIGVAGTPAFTGDRIVYVIPGIKVTDSAAVPPKEVTLPGAYTAAAIAGLLSSRDPHISPTNKPIAVAGLEVEFNAAQLKNLVTAGTLAIEKRRGFRVVKGITTDNGAFRQITTRRIVDFAKFGVRSAAEPYIGLLNNDRVRKALKGSINGFLAGMVDDEMLVSYELDVSATRDEEIRGIARVTMTVRPTFSIDFVKVVMFLG